MKNNIRRIFKLITISLILFIIYYVLINTWIISYPSSYIKYTCKWKHFSCEQNMSKECMSKKLCIN